MPATRPKTKIDPLGAFAAGAFTVGDRRPVPLVATRFDVDIAGGLASVTTKRMFRNEEDESIEATITFPVPVRAVLFDLEARIDGRLLKARAQRRKQARETYEDAIDRGKPAVLHEEVLRGVHMLSIAHIPPGAEIEVSSTWAATLAFVDEQGSLRIPLTVGDIYGRSGLPDSDDLIHGGPSGQEDLTVRCRDGQVRLSDGRLEDGHARVPLDAPIDLVVTGPARETLRGRAADGREVALTIRPCVGGDGALDVAFLIDHSGSMNEVCSGASRGVTKHQAVIRGLRSLARRLRDEDGFDLWEFDNQLAHVGSTADTQRRGLFGLGGRLSAGEQMLRLLDRLKGPAGGTEIGAALAGTIRGSNARDILVVTDGKSHALDVQTLARMGRRVHVVLVGEDSLEANVGHLAALTGGDILVAAGADLGEILLAAVDSLRAPFEAPSRIEGRVQHLRVVRGNAVTEADWRPARGGDGEDPHARAVAAFAASLALPCLDEDAATALAEAEGLVTHLTSLVLVDEASKAQDGLPATRKVALPTPRTAGFQMDLQLSCAPSMLGEDRAEAGATPVVAAYSAPGVGRIDLSRVAARIDWDVAPNRLRAGDLSSLDREVARMIEQAAALPEVIALANRLGVTPAQLVLALLARTCAGANRSATRLARAILGARISPEIEALYAQLGLTGTSGTERDGPTA